MTKPVVVCVLRSGGDFQLEHVGRLYDGLRAHGYSGHVVCLSDEYGVPPTGWSVPWDGVEMRQLLRKWPGWWSKLELCAPEQDNLGDVLYLDLDTTVVGSLQDIAGMGRLMLLQDFSRRGRLASGVMYLPVAARRRAWAHLLRKEPAVVMRVWQRTGDQGFFQDAWPEAPRWQETLPGQIVSYKLHVQETSRVPAGARLVCFHGQPRPWDVDWRPA